MAQVSATFCIPQSITYNGTAMQQNYGNRYKVNNFLQICKTFSIFFYVTAVLQERQTLKVKVQRLNFRTAKGC